MINFIRADVLPCNKGIAIVAEIEPNPCYASTYISKIAISTSDTFISGQTVQNPIYTKDIEGRPKEIIMTISSELFKTPQEEGTLFFVWIFTGIDSGADPSCLLEPTLAVTAAIDTTPIYRLGLKYLKEAQSECEAPRNFIDFILRLKAFTISLEAKDYNLAAYYWKKFFKSIKTPNYECNCHRTDSV